MQNRQRVPLALVALLVLATPAVAEWRIEGSFEPDTPHDVGDALMWLDPDTAATDTVLKVYFNAMPEDRNVLYSPNPNVAAGHSRYVPAGQMGFQAYLGVWKDCNQDGYVGFGERAVLEYHDTLLTNKTVCPRGSFFNKMGSGGHWVSEFVPIGNASGMRPQPFPRIINDTHAEVWGDFGRPDDPAGVHFDCPQLPLPRGTTESTGGMLVYADCQIGYNVAKAVNRADSDGGLGLRFDDVHHPERDCDSKLNQRTPGGTYGNDPCHPNDAGSLEDHSGDPAFTVWDCSSDARTGTVDARDPTAPQGSRGAFSYVDLPEVGGYGGRTYLADENGTYARYEGVPPARAGLHDAEGSYADGLNNAYNGARYGCQRDPGLAPDVEADFSATDPSDGKRLVDFWMDFNQPSGGISALFAGSMPGSTGIRLSGGHYSSEVTYLPPPYLGPTIRNEDLAPAPALWFTFYARVGSVTTGMGADVPGTGGVYGAEPCGTHTTGVRNNWDCDASHWWNTELGGTAEPFPGRTPRVGWDYDLRDVDCYDGVLVEGAPVHASLVQVSSGPCPSPYPEEE